MGIDSFSENMIIASGKFDEEISYWRNKLDGDIVMGKLQYDHLCPANRFKNGIVSARLDSAIYEKILKISNSSDYGIYMLLLSGLMILLWKHTRAEDITIGMPTFSQNGKSNHFISKFLALRQIVDGNMMYKDLLAGIRNVINEADTYKNIPFSKISEFMKYNVYIKAPLFNTVALLNTIHCYNEDEDAFNADTVFYFSKLENSIDIKVEYNQFLYEKDTIKRFLGHLLNILNAVLENPAIKISDVSFLSKEEYDQILFAFNESNATYPDDVTIHKLFEQQVEKTPNNTALVFNGEKLSYKELNRKANQLARTLREKGVQAGSIVAVIMERSFDMIIGVLGILKAGGAYLPIDSDIPRNRIEAILNDSGAMFLLSKERFIKNGNDTPFVNTESICTIILLDSLSDAISQNSGDNLSELNTPHDLAYIIYTSGSTGKPKGVMIEHKNVIRLLINDKFQFEFSENDVWTMFHSFCFDFSVWEMYGALLYGGCLVVVPRDIAQDPEEFLKLLEVNCVTVLNQTPTAFYSLCNTLADRQNPNLRLKYVIFGGEALKPGMLKVWKSIYPNTKLINMYGITETTVHVTYKEITGVEIESNISNIGKPIPTSKTYIMDEKQNILPVGLAGELCVGGDGVARGYLNRDELTNIKFIENPYKPGEIIYRSGDLARFLPNGEMEYLGRIDQQVKIRGHRIELGEVEHVILKFAHIREVLVIASEENSNKCICAYFVADSVIAASDIREFMKNELPDYMIPAYFIQLDKIPRTINGKADIKSLPDIGRNMISSNDYEPPANDMEKKILDIWQEVLTVNNIGVNDNFFTLGGDSIKAVILANRINKIEGVNVSVKDIYVNPTIKSLSMIAHNSCIQEVKEHQRNGLRMISDIKNKIMEDEKQRILIADRYEDFYPLSKIQQGMVFYSKLKNDEPIYHDQFTFMLKFKKFDFNIFCKSFKLLMEKHQVLRTTFDIENFYVPLQFVHKEIEPDITMEDISQNAGYEQGLTIRKYLKSDLGRRFNFGNELLWRLKIFKLTENDYFIILSFQHAILDGWSEASLNVELIGIYNRLIDGLPYELKRLKSTYKDYVAINLSRSSTPESQEYWRKILEGYSRNKLPFNFSRKRINDVRGTRIFRKQLSKELLGRLEGLAKKVHCSLKEICLSAYLYLLAIITTESDVVSGVVTHDRPIIDDSEKILGCFLNTIPVRMKIEKCINKLELIKKVNDFTTAVKPHELFLAEIAGITGEPNSDGNPIFDTIFNFTDFYVFKGIESIEEVISEPDKDWLIEPNEMTNTLFDLEISKTLNEFNMQIKYSPNYFCDNDIKTSFNMYVKILEKLADESCNDLNGIDLLSPDYIEHTLFTFNNTLSSYPKEKTIHRLFEEQTERTPDNIALVFNGKHMTYRELNERSNQLARFLQNNGVSRCDYVALIAQRGFEMIVGVYAILKCGCAYIPVDPEYPAERQEYIVTNSKVSAILADRNYALNSAPLLLIDLDSISHLPSENLNMQKDFSDIAYVIYTSGSTGVPKGVMIEHHSAVNLITWVNNKFDISQNDVLLFVTPMCFDLSVYDIFGLLASGGRIVITEKKQVQNPHELKQLLIDNRITFWDSVPSTMSYLVNYLEEEDSNYNQHDLRLVFLSGDWIPVKLPARISKYFSKAKVISLGGATEGTVWSIYYPIESVGEYQTSIPYGKPIANNYFYILDEGLNPVSEGVAGELYIGGVGVARGYINDKKKTETSFIKNKFIRSGNELMYKTGDLGRMLPDGNIEFLGRIDHQVKIRGFRVELGEIENAILKHEFVKDAVVIDRVDSTGNKQLCAYFVSIVDTEIPDIREFLLKKLPDYMVPAYFVRLDSIPLTTNGKIDRKALPEPESGFHLERSYAAPENDVQSKLVMIWQEVLGLDGGSIGINDNFFEIGGHSLSATTLVSKIHKAYDVMIPLKEVFIRQTVKSLAEYIDKAEKSNIYKSIEPVETQDFYQLSSAQKRLFILDRLEGCSTTYNMPSITLVEGTIDREHFGNIARQLVKRHDAFRTAIVVVNGKPVQKIFENVDFKLEYLEADGTSIGDSVNVKRFIQPFKLDEPPLLRIKLLKLGEGKHMMFIDMHHIISDGTSIGILIKEFTDLYRGDELPPLRIQYRDFAYWQNKLSESEYMKKSEEYWLNLLSGKIPVMDLPTDYERPLVKSYDGDRVYFRINNERTKDLKAIASETNTTLFMVLLSAFNILMHKYTAQTDILIGVGIAGRPHADLENIIGMFVNMLVMRNHPMEEKTFIEFLSEVRENSLKAFENQDYQFEELVDKLKLERDPGRNPIVDVVFTLQNMDIPNVEINGLKFMPYESDTYKSKFDLTLFATEMEDGIQFVVEYSTDLFSKTTIENLSQHLIKIINILVSDRNIKLRDIEILDKNRMERISEAIIKQRQEVAADIDF